MYFFLRDGDAQRAQGAVFMDDIDLIHSERESSAMGPKLVAVAVRHVNGCSIHVCQICGEAFDESAPKLRGQEVHMGTAIMKLHGVCAAGGRKRGFRSFSDILRGMQSRRFYAKATRPFAQEAK